MLAKLISAHRRVKPTGPAAGGNVPVRPASMNWADAEVNSGGWTANLLFFYDVIVFFFVPARRGFVNVPC